MSLNYQKDPAAQVPTLTTGLDGVDSIVRFYQDGTSEVKNLLKNECSVIYECSYCRSLFRSIVNFVAHKRTICRSLQSSVRLELERTVHSKRVGSENEKNASTSSSSKSRRNPTSLRRLNLASMLGKHIQNFNVNLDAVDDTIEIQTLPKVFRPTASTTFCDGRQTVEALPASLSIKDHIPEDRTVLVIPQDHSIRYREMQLRTRRNANDAKSVNCRELSQQDIEILQRIPSDLLDLADLQELRCTHENCANIQPFASIAIISHHLAISHQKEVFLQSASCNVFSCFICGGQFETERVLQDHFNENHFQERTTHVNQRIALSKVENASSRRGNVTQKNKRSSSPEETTRHRSISPSDISSRNSNVSTELYYNEDNEVNEMKPPILEPEVSERSRRMSLRRRPHSAATSRRNSPRDASTTPVKPEMQLIAAKRPKLNSSPEKPANKKTMRTITPLINSDEARHLDELLNTASTATLCSLEKEESEDDDNSRSEEPSIAKPPTTDVDKNIAMPAGRVQRNKRPTKRFYNEDFVVDPTKVKEGKASNTNKTPTNAELKDKRFKTRPADVEAEIELQVPKMTASEAESYIRAKLNDTTAPVKLSAPKRRIRAKSSARVRSRLRTKSKNIVTSQQQSEDNEPSTNVIEQAGNSPHVTNSVNNLNSHCDTKVTLEYIDNDTDLESRKGVIDKALRAELDAGESVISIRPLLSLSTPQKATSEPPVRQADESDSPIRQRSDSVVNLNSNDTVEDKQSSEDNSDKSLSVLKPRDEEDRGDKSPSKKEPFLLPSNSSTSSSSLVRKQLPSVLADKNRELLAFYTPRALKARIAEEERLHDANAAVGSSRRKQNLKEVGSPAQKEVAPPRPDDLAEIPVYLTEAQRDMFFSPLRPLFNSTTATDGLHQCSECGEVLRCQRDGRRHMVGHLRVMRIRCMLCDVGAFFCGDMRIHLMFRHCEKLNLAPEGFVQPGDIVPCMDKQKADLLTQLVDPFHPGRVFFTSGKIISWTNPKAYFPDPRIEERILGKARPRRSTSLAPTPVKSKISAVSSPVRSASTRTFATNGTFGKSILNQNVNSPNYCGPTAASSSMSIGSNFQREVTSSSFQNTHSSSTQPNILSSPHKVVLMKPTTLLQLGETNSTDIAEERKQIIEASTSSIVNDQSDFKTNDLTINGRDHEYCPTMIKSTENSTISTGISQINQSTTCYNDTEVEKYINEKPTDSILESSTKDSST